MKKYLLVIAATATLMGCDTTVQTTSGKDYLSQYADVPVAASTKIKAETGTGETKSIDQRVREVAAVEPILKFPARIGLARIDSGSLSNIPVEEADAWNKTREKLGTQFGEFIPVNIMVAEMVSVNQQSSGCLSCVKDIINTIRLGAARQHLDAVLIYEVLSKESSSDNILKIADLSIIGGYILPSQRHDVEGFANALLIDVVQGYPYGTIQTTVEKEGRVSSSWGWGSSYSDTVELSDKIKTKAAKQLSDEAYDMFMRLRTELAEKQMEK